MISRMRTRTGAGSMLLFLICLASALNARVVRIEIASRSDVLGGKTFGGAGAYERIIGRVYFSVVAADPHNRQIVDLDKASNLAHGEVAFSSDFVGFRPKDPAKSNGSLLLEVPNRGKSRILALVDGGDWDLAQDAGDAWVLRQGYSMAALGWQWDATGTGALRLYAPVATENGKAIEGLLRGDLMLARAAQEIPLGHLILGNIGGSEYPVSKPDDPRNVLTVRDTRDAKRTVVPRSDWQFAQTVNGKLTPSNRSIHLNGGFAPGKIYEYVYVVSDPVVAGLGFAAVRDFASYAKHTPEAVISAQRVYGEGISQDGRFLRDLLYEGFNADEQGRIALNGVLAHVAGAGRGSFNYRFAQPSRDAQPTSSVFFPTDIFPFTGEPETDPVTRQTRGLLDRARAEHVVPKVFLSNTSYEYWGRVASLIHSSPDGLRDLAISPDIRVYHLTGLQHFSGPFPPAKGTGDLAGDEPQSPLPVEYFWRAMITNMDAWVRGERLPPESSYPLIVNATLVSLRAYAFPAIPHVEKPHEANQAYRLDYGPNWQSGILSIQPPKIGRPFPVLVPQVDADGNERDGVRLPEIVVPLATYTGWNLRDPSIGAPGERVSFEGSYLPFPRTNAERRNDGDPRRSIEERYASVDDYLRRYMRALDALLGEGWVIPEDRAALLARAKQEWEQATK